MLPAFRAGQIVVGLRTVRSYQCGDIVIFDHAGLEKLKRITEMRLRENICEIFVKGDNNRYSTDSRDFGWLPVKTVKGLVIWPRSRTPLP